MLARVRHSIVVLPSAAALGLVAALVPMRAAAQTADTCVMLPAPESPAPEAVREHVQSVVADRLREHGNVVIAPRDAQLRMVGQPMRDCAAIDCAAGVNRFLGTGFAVLTEIAWVGGRVTMVNVALIGLEDGESVGGQAEVVAGDVDAAVRGAFQAAWDRWVASQQGYLIITTTPPGAFVELDGQSLGRAPLRRLFRAGAHTLRITLEGHRAVTREITLDRHEEREVAITLTEGEGEEAIGAAPATATREETHWASYAIGGALIAGGIAALVSPIWTLADLGAPVGTDGVEYVSFGPVSGTLLGIGAAAILGGVVMMIVGPIRTSVVVTPERAQLSIGGWF